MLLTKSVAPLKPASSDPVRTITTSVSSNRILLSCKYLATDIAVKHPVKSSVAPCTILFVSMKKRFIIQIGKNMSKIFEGKRIEQIERKLNKNIKIHPATLKIKLQRRNFGPKFPDHLNSGAESQ